MLENELKLIQESGILLILPCGRLQNLVNQVGTAPGVLEGQTCAAWGPESNVNYWMHYGFVTNNGEKMSKSLGNFFTIRDVTRSDHPLALSKEALSSSRALKGLAVRVSREAEKCIKKLRNELETRLADDLHTPTLLNAALQEALRFMNTSLNKMNNERRELSVVILSLTELEKEVKAVLDVLGLLAVGSTYYAEVLQQFKDRVLIRAELMEEDILHAIAERALARKNKEFARSDQLEVIYWSSELL
ncbi:hypothetical protein K7X08_012075 [Anisodus acutangulus]|uniref:tRNA synthetases class I catalytic domain-containing protein n=1 Tax=Anisodus acutangulus TaxID=402998 RepID=A0A9Q1LAN3_9SOLA|nr:hypothetical protein K7X08_012075 [Anisodus acutangulus]